MEAVMDPDELTKDQQVKLDRLWRKSQAAHQFASATAFQAVRCAIRSPRNWLDEFLAIASVALRCWIEYLIAVVVLMCFAGVVTNSMALPDSVIDGATFVGFTYCLLWLSFAGLRLYRLESRFAQIWRESFASALASAQRRADLP